MATPAAVAAAAAPEYLRLRAPTAAPPTPNGGFATR